uniref:Uncharacterized protein n=1 Tax=Opuntia streptacantha TaxID=393608 RepID=A0A7C9DL79_OPUST
MLDCWKQISAPRIRSNPSGFLCTMALMWSAFPHSSFSATRSAQGGVSDDACKSMFLCRILRTSSLWSVNTTFSQNLAHSTPVTPTPEPNSITESLLSISAFLER